MIGDTLKRIRGIYGYKANTMCEKLSISSSYLSEIENNKKKPSLELLERYSKIFDIKLSTLILLSEEYETYHKTGDENILMKKMMLLLIDKFSNENETE